ncbi:dihydrodipicolinate synthase family protein [Vibrio sp. 404]|uniref:Dihydrodipicolinate synthase family protein n=1 Tax=Vibrio marinisediminis TaxID=2758441 RepID=A0A7W2ITI7_9VIBR|nr:dihydrodipicolinate synthase family protein [Vibrio marinisediminis]MBA5762520.1 dihydrodipicolinate synthase family protein [Vibrio marinisediminis]
MTVLTGIFTVLTTPFNDKGEIDFATLAQQINYQIDAGIHGLLLCGATGEYSTMSVDERKAIVEAGAEVIAGRVPFVVGTISMDPRETVALSNHAHDHGAACMMILSPPTSGCDMDEVFEFYKYISDNSYANVMIYNNPYSSGIDIDVDTIVKVAKLPRVIAIKESSGNIRRQTEIRARTNAEQFTIFCGWEDMVFESFTLGTRAWISMSANFAPRAVVKLYDYIMSGETDKAWAQYQQIQPFCAFLEEGKPAQICKYSLYKLGLNERHSACRPPRLPLSDAQRQLLDQMLEQQRHVLG